MNRHTARRGQFRFKLLSVVIGLTLGVLLLAQQQPPTSVNVNAKPAPVVITSLSVSTGPVGTAVTITGSGFGAVQGSSTVTFFSGQVASISSWSSLSISTTVPAGATTGSVIVTVGAVLSNGSTFTVTAGSFYTLPNNDADCPTNCRVIPWLAGTDVWNGTATAGSGSIPSYTSVACNGLTEGDQTAVNNAATINSCLTALLSGQASLIAPGIYYVNSAITTLNNKVLRGSGSRNCAQGTSTPGPAYSLTSTWKGDTGVGAACTTLVFGNNGWINNGGGEGDWTGVLGTPVVVSSGYTKGSTAIVVASASGIAVNDWIVIYEDADSAIPVAVNDCGSWCGALHNGTTGYMSQLMQVSGVSGTTLTLSRPLYYTFKSALNPKFYELTPKRTRSGLESIKLWGTGSLTNPIVGMLGSVQGWVYDVEIYRDSSGDKTYPIYGSFMAQNELRMNYIHDQNNSQSGRAYGIGLMYTTSDNLMVDNIVVRQRHLGGQEGGGSGNVWIYNYLDDSYYTYDNSISDGPRLNHGAHPYMILFEGNIANKVRFDWTHGTSSHNVIFRNWLRGDTKGDIPGFSGSVPDYGFIAVSIDQQNHYFSVIGNVMGWTSAVGGSGSHTTWTAGTVFTANCNYQYSSQRTTPYVYGLGCDDNANIYDSVTRSTAILHANWDAKTQGYAFTDGGSNTTLANSLYYPSKPSFFGGCTWPVVDASTHTVNDLPAKKRYDSGTC